MLQALLCVLIGLVAGISSGLFGIGGGVILVPAAIYLLGFSQKKAQGTSLVALLLPVGALAVWEYWKQSAVDLTAGAYIVLGFLGGSVVGSRIALGLSDVLLRRCFAAFLVLIALQLVLKK
jgi:uncharacterized membrane protein YfcA